MNNWIFHSYSALPLKAGEHVVSAVFDGRSGHVLVFTDIGGVYIVENLG